MAQKTVQCSAEVSADPDTVWAQLRGFCTPWHPAIAAMTPEDKGQVRAFSVMGDDTLYRERLTWFSDSDRAMQYTHVQGIEGVASYDGQFAVEASESAGAVIVMRAQIEAEGERLREISSGTQAIFETGLDALGDVEFSAKAPRQTSQPTVATTSAMIGGTPMLATSRTPKREGPFCLFLHGIGGNRYNWDAQLAQTGAILPSAALDLRGYGDSELGPEQSRLEDHFADILRVRDAVGAEKLVLCGLSYGAWIATAFAETHPHMLAGLVLAGGCTGMSEATPLERANFRDAREKPLQEGQTPADFAADVMDTISGPNITDQAKQSLFSSMASIPSATYRDALTCFTNPPKAFDFSRLTMPVLMMTGAYDRLAPPAEIRAVSKRVQHASPMSDVRFEVIKGAGHVCNVEAPDRFNAPLLEFLTRLTP